MLLFNTGDVLIILDLCAMSSRQCVQSIKRKGECGWGQEGEGRSGEYHE